MIALEKWQELSNQAVEHRQAGRFREAHACLSRCVLEHPEVAEVCHNLGMVYEDVGNFETGLACFKVAYDMHHSRESSLALGQALLRQGRWQEAWPYWENGRFNYSWRETPGIKTWAGESLQGKRLLIVREGGYGDAFLYSRWFDHPKLLESESMSFVVWKSMISLLEGQLMVDELIPVEDGIITFSDFDYMVPLMSLPTLCGATVENTEPIKSSIAVWPSGVKELSKTKPNVGICWRAEESGAVRKTRSIEPSELAPLQECDVNWISLYPDEKLDWAENPNLFPWKRTAEIIRELDLVISVDTAVAHLAGCMGIPVWTILPLNSEWKWLLDREDTVWYKSMRLFRNTDPLSFKPAIEKVCEALRGLH